MIEIEKRKEMVNPNYLSNYPELTFLMRAMVVDWMMEVASDYEFCRNTLYLAVSYLDKYLSLDTKNCN
jgi:cyclin A